MPDQSFESKWRKSLFTLMIFCSFLTGILCCLVNIIYLLLQSKMPGSIFIGILFNENNWFLITLYTSLAAFPITLLYIIVMAFILDSRKKLFLFILKTMLAGCVLLAIESVVIPVYNARLWLMAYVYISCHAASLAIGTTIAYSAREKYIDYDSENAFSFDEPDYKNE